MQYKHFRNFVQVAFLSGFLVACGGDDSSEISLPGDNLAVVKTVAADYSGSDVELVDLDDNYAVTPGIIPSDQSDFVLKRRGQYFYHIGRYNIDSVAKYDIEDPTNAIYEYSTLDNPEEPTSNPQTLTFVNDEKAYLIRYGADQIWVVNPNAATEDDFKLGEIDISAYADADGVSEAVDAVVVGDELYVVLQRQVYFSPSEEGVSAYLAVFDISTDTEIDTNPDDDPSNLKGIELALRNPTNISYDVNAGLLVQSVGDYGYSRPRAYTGGIEEIDTIDYSTEVLIDDGDDNDHPYGLITNMLVVDSENAYFVGYVAYQDSSLYHFNPTSGVVTGSVSSLEGVDISALALGPNNVVWVGVGDVSTPRIELINSSQENIQTILLNQNPSAIAFGF